MINVLITGVKNDPADKIDNRLTDDCLDSLLDIESAFPEQPCRSPMKNAQLFLHLTLLPMGLEDIPVGVSGDFISCDREAAVIKALSGEIHGQEEVMIGTHSIANVIGVRQ